MHAIQGAVAVRRERQKRENKRKLSQKLRSLDPADAAGLPNGAQRRPSDRPSLGEGSQSSLFAGGPPPKPQSSLTSFHLGVVFILLGFIMVFSSMIPRSSSASGTNNSSKMMGVGTTFIIIGLVMVMVNRIITSREEEELAKYVKTRLARTRSGHAIGRELENGEERYHRSLLRPIPSARSHSGGSIRRQGSHRLSSKRPSIRIELSPSETFNQEQVRMISRANSARSSRSVRSVSTPRNHSLGSEGHHANLLNALRVQGFEKTISTKNVQHIVAEVQKPGEISLAAENDKTEKNQNLVSAADTEVVCFINEHDMKEKQKEDCSK